jgi:hypothetical protein
MIEHGPFYTHTGALFFARSKGGKLSTTFSVLPGWEKTVERYDPGPFFAGRIG